MPTSLKSKHLADLHELARERGIDRYRMLSRDELIDALGDSDDSADDGPVAERDESASGKSSRRRRGGRGRDRSRRDDDKGSDDERGSDEDEQEEEGAPVTGVLEITSRGHGFVRREEDPDDEGDVYVSPSQIRRCELNDGDLISGPARKPRRGERHPALIHIDTVNGAEPGAPRSRFEELEARHPHRRLELSGEGLEGNERTLIRSLDLLVPLARGQRVLVEAARGSGRTTLLRALARELSGKEGLGVVVVLIDERPEEAPAWREALPDAELAIATADMRPKEQLRLVELAIAQAKRRVEAGEDVVVLIDSLSRLAVAADDPGAVKPIFAAGRETASEEAGSLTVIATVLTDGGEGVAEALRTTENVTVALSGELAEAGIYPALDATVARVVGEEELREDPELEAARELRAQLARLDAREAAERLAAEAK